MKKYLAVYVSMASVFLLASVFSCAEEVIPDFYKEPGISKNRDNINTSFGEHIDPFTGSLQQHYVDIHIPGNGGFDLDVTRSYNSASIDQLNPARGTFEAGLGWTMHFGRVLKSKDNFICTDKIHTVADNPTLELPDGSRQLLTFTDSGTPLMLSVQRWRAECIVGGTLGLAIYSPEGTRYDMTQFVNIGTATSPVYAWYTTKITDRNGNYADVSYKVTGGNNPEINNISTNDGRVVSFTYEDSGLLSRRISTVSTNDGRTYTYQYEAIPSYPGKYQLIKVLRPEGSNWNYQYYGNLNTSAGSYMMSQVTYPMGGVINYNYGFVYFDTQANPSSRATVVSSKNRSTGGVWSYSYTPGGPGVYDTTTETNPAGTVTYKHIGPNYSSSGTVWMVGLLVSKQMGDKQTEVYTWDKQPISSENNFRPGAFVAKVDIGAVNVPVLKSKQIVRDGATYTTTYSDFDSYGNPKTVAEVGVNGGNRTTALTYKINTAKWIIHQIENESYTGSSTGRSFDDNGNVLSITRDGVTTSYTYDAGNISTIKYPRGLLYSYSDYWRGIPRYESQPEGIVISRKVSNAGNVTSETNGENDTTSYDYDGLNRLKRVDYPANNPVIVSYGVASKTATRGSLTESTGYDGFGNVKSVTMGGITRTYNYDALDRQLFASHPDSSLGTNYQYDILDRVTLITEADSRYSNINWGAGSVNIIDLERRSTTKTFRIYGNPDQQLLMSVSSPESSANYSLTRNAVGKVDSVTQAGITRAYHYDSRYFVDYETNPETGMTLYGRDDAGNMTSKRVGSSATAVYGYDGQNRLASVTYSDSTPAVTNTYYKTNKIKTVSTPANTRTYLYEKNGQLSSNALTIDGKTLATTYTYDGNDHLATVQYPVSGNIVDYAPDVLGRATKAGDYITHVDYWPSGLVKQLNYANGTVSSYGQDDHRLWVNSFSTNKGSSQYINSSYGYDGVGNLKNINDNIDNSYNRTNSYDGIDRLTDIAGPWGSGKIIYDGKGNLVNQAMGSFGLSYSYDGSNKLSSVTGYRSGAFAYDALGNVISGPGNGYIYDAASNLRCINCNNQSAKIEYSYDGQNQRATVDKAGKRTYEIYGESNNLLTEYIPSEKSIEYIYVGGKRIAQAEYDLRSTSCGLSVNSTSIAYLDSAIFTVSGTKWPVGAKYYWYGTRNGSADVSGDLGGSGPGSFSMVNNVGTNLFTRYVQVRDAQNNVICSSNTVTVSFAAAPVCNLSASKATVPFGESTLFTISGQNFPSGAQYYWSGTADGVTDVSGLLGGTAPGTQSFTNNVGAKTYVRQVEIRNAQNKAVCTSNSVTVTFQATTALTCSLSASKATVPYGDTGIFTVSGQNLPASANYYWYGSRDGVSDLSGTLGGAAPGNQTYTNNIGAASLIRYAQIRDAQNNVVCTTNTVNLAYQANVQTPTCALTTSKTTVPYGDTGVFTVTGQNLPTGATFSWFGSRDGRTDVVDTFGGSVPGSQTYTNNIGAANFIRFAQIKNAQNYTVCTTNSVNVAFLAAVPTPTCALTTSKTSVAYGDTGVFTVSGQNLPVGANYYWYGSRDGVTDASGALGGAVPGNQTYTNNIGAANFVRYAQIRDAQNLAVCTTNTVNVAFQADTTPTCSLSADKSDVPLNQTWNVTIDGQNLPSGAQFYWYGTKNGSTDATGQYGGVAPSSQSYTNSAGAAGTYTRSAQIRDAQGQAVCTTNSITATFEP